jgi:hypothetical protein
MLVFWICFYAVLIDLPLCYYIWLASILFYLICLYTLFFLISLYALLFDLLLCASI